MSVGGGSIAGGIVLLVYFGAIGLCWMALGAARSAAARRTWRAIVVTLAVLMIEKAFHVEALLVGGFGHVAQGGGWYGVRRDVQLEAIGGLAVVGGLLVIATAWLSRRAGIPAQIAGSATVALVAFVAIRTVSLHQLDRLFASGFGPLRISNIVELAALCVIGGAAWRVGRPRPRA